MVNDWQKAKRSNVTLASALEEEAHNKDLQGTHSNNKEALDHAEVDNSVFSADNGCKVAVFSGAEVLLVARDGGKLAGNLVDGLLKHGCLLVRRALLGR